MMVCRPFKASLAKQSPYGSSSWKSIISVTCRISSVTLDVFLTFVPTALFCTLYHFRKLWKPEIRTWTASWTLRSLCITWGTTRRNYGWSLKVWTRRMMVRVEFAVMFCAVVDFAAFSSFWVGSLWSTWGQWWFSLIQNKSQTEGEKCCSHHQAIILYNNSSLGGKGLVYI